MTKSELALIALEDIAKGYENIQCLITEPGVRVTKCLDDDAVRVICPACLANVQINEYREAYESLHTVAQRVSEEFMWLDKELQKWRKL